MVNIDDLRFDKDGLIPAIVIDSLSKRVLTLAYMNRESLEISIEKKRTCFWSRSRGELWLKGESSGNYQNIVSITADCDRDALLVSVEPQGPACHLGGASCFEDELWVNNAKSEFSIDGLMELLLDRKRTLPQGSYTTYLFEKGLDKILKKVGEESTEVIIGAKSGDKSELIYEIADLTYHIMVLMASENVSLEEIRRELGSRHIIEHKIKQEKMV